MCLASRRALLFTASVYSIILQHSYKYYKYQEPGSGEVWALSPDEQSHLFIRRYRATWERRERLSVDRLRSLCAHCNQSTLLCFYFFGSLFKRWFSFYSLDVFFTQENKWQATALQWISKLCDCSRNAVVFDCPSQTWIKGEKNENAVIYVPSCRSKPIHCFSVKHKRKHLKSLHTALLH